MDENTETTEDTLVCQKTFVKNIARAAKMRASDASICRNFGYFPWYFQEFIDFQGILYFIKLLEKREKGETKEEEN